MRGPAPLEEPLRYPGERPRAPFLLHGDVVSALPTELRRRRARSRPRHRLERVPGAAGARSSAARPAATSFRRSVVTVDALVVRPSAHFGRAGYWPFAPARLDASTTECVLTLLDDDQVAVLDRTEPNYDRVVLDPAVHRVAAWGRRPSSTRSRSTSRATASSTTPAAALDRSPAEPARPALGPAARCGERAAPRPAYPRATPGSCRTPCGTGRTTRSTSRGLSENTSASGPPGSRPWQRGASD